MAIDRVQNGFLFGFYYFFVNHLLFGQGVKLMSYVFGIGFWVEGGLNYFLHLLCSAFQLLTHRAGFHGLEWTFDALAYAAFVNWGFNGPSEFLRRLWIFFDDDGEILIKGPVSADTFGGFVFLSGSSGGWAGYFFGLKGSRLIFPGVIIDSNVYCRLIDWNWAGHHHAGSEFLYGGGVEKISFFKGLGNNGVLVSFREMFVEISLIDFFLEAKVLVVVDVLMFEILPEFLLLFGRLMEMFPIL